MPKPFGRGGKKRWQAVHAVATDGVSTVVVALPDWIGCSKRRRARLAKAMRGLGDDVLLFSFRASIPESTKVLSLEEYATEATSSEHESGCGWHDGARCDCAGTTEATTLKAAIVR
jgi:hypothetical protein